jgi:Xaa-Pro aminopeptidase
MHSERLRRLQKSLSNARLDFFLVTYLSNIRYLVGFSGSAGVLVIESEDGGIFFTDGRYREQARQEVRGARVVIAKKPPLLAAAEWLRSRTARKRSASIIGIEPAHLSVGDRDRLASAMPRSSRLKNAPPLIEQQRMMKDEAEIALVRNAVLAGAALFDVLLKTIRPRRKENAVAAELEYAARRAGCEGMSFETIIASGSRSALPHGRASDERIPGTGFVVCDFGVILAGYCSDMTRTVHVGQATREARNFYAAVREAQLAGVDAARPGISVAEVDRVARSVLKKAGLGRYFTHSTGHGVGLEIHEAPRIASGQTEILQPGMVITIEPGAYIPGKWGVRVEDMVLVTERGHEVLTPTSKDLICI